MDLELITPEKVLYSGDVYLIKVPGTKGSFEILKNHVPIVSTLDAGKIKVISSEGKEYFFDIKSGFIEFRNNKISVLVTL
jgi:F-type H+-transporting ATPase subunit epsilon